MGDYYFVFRTKTRDKIATMYMYNILIIYSSKKDTLESVETKNKLMLAQRRRQWANISPTLFQRLVLAEVAHGASEQVTSKQCCQH